MVGVAGWSLGAGGYEACNDDHEHGGIILYGSSQEFAGEYTQVDAGWRYSDYGGTPRCTFGAFVYWGGSTSQGVPCPAGLHESPNPGWGSLLP